jgi:hypothetical protein
LDIAVVVAEDVIADFLPLQNSPLIQKKKLGANLEIGKWDEVGGEVR